VNNKGSGSMKFLHLKCL